MDSDSIQLVHLDVDIGSDRGPVVELDQCWAAAAGDLFAASHAEYPAFRAVFPEAGRRHRALRAFFTATVADATAAGVVRAVLAGSVVLGAAVWLPPDGFPWTIRRQLAAGPAFARVAAAAPTRFPTFVRYGANAQRAHPHDRHWYLVALGVRPEAQRTGIGTALMVPALDRADGDEVDCYLETSDRANLAFYQRLGFEVVDDALALVPGRASHVAMRRRPKPR